MRPEVSELASVLRGRRLVALTGAGCSTESGIPDYRGPETRHRTIRPILGPDFVRSTETRVRYWARSMLGWPVLASARPNDAHRALAALEERGALLGLLTQNVDRLHRAAGSRRVIELHGAVAEVECLDCAAIEARAEVQERLVDQNRAWIEASSMGRAAADGDAELDEDRVASFRVVACLACGGRLKPRVVFFGDNVPRPVVEQAFAMLGGAEALLVVGTSLTVFSGYRFVRRAAELRIPVAIVNIGPTRGDHAATIRVDGRAGSVLPDLARALTT
jgi:NAD+-dependent protein deacetylase sirtuin 4